MMAAPEQVRVGIVGLGHRGQWWIELCRRVKGCRLTALCEKIEPLLLKASARAQDPSVRCYTDFETMLKEAEVDAVAVVTAPHDQPELICRALEAGKHVVCEVALTYDLGDLWRVVVAVENSGLKFQMAEQIMYSAFVKAWRKLIAEGQLGKVLYAEGQYIHGMTPDRFWVDAETGERLNFEQARNNPRAAKSRFWNWFPHPIVYIPTGLAPLLAVLDDEVDRVTCMATRPQSYHYTELPTADLEVALMHTRNDAIIRMAAGYTYPTGPGHYRWHVEGTGGRVETGRALHESGKLWLANSFMAETAPIRWEYSPQDIHPEAIGSGHGGCDYFALATFIESIQQDTTPPLDIYRAANITAASLIAIRSVEQGSACLKVPDFRPSAQRPRGQFPGDL
jgi:predicted dehydrogenase